MAWVCEKTFGRGVLRQPAPGAGGRAWNITVPTGRSGAGHVKGLGETGQIGQLIDLLMDAAGPDGQAPVPEPPGHKDLRHKLDRLLRCSRNLKAGHQGVRIAIQIPGSDPVSIDAVGSGDLADLLEA
jgi:hypothetical protein